MKVWVAALVLVFLSVCASGAQQIIQKGSWKLEDNGTPFTILGSYPTVEECQVAYQKAVKDSEAAVAADKKIVDDDNNNYPGPLKAQFDMQTWQNDSAAAELTQGAICVQQ